MWFAWWIWLAAAAATPAHELTLRVGQPVPFNPGALPAQVICDDLSVVRVADAGQTLQLTGLRPGSTLCSFGTPAYSGRRILYRFNVVP
jgi:hypothetical protein